MGNSAYRKLQGAFETTPGTKANATFVWRGTGQPEDLRVIKTVKEDLGIMVGTDRTYVSQLSAKLDLDSTEMTFEQGHIPFLAGVQDTTPTSDGVGTGKVWTFNPSVKTIQSVRKLSIEGGDDTDVEVGTYFFVTEIKVSGKAGEALKISASLLGRTLDGGTFTSNVTLTTVEDILFSKGALYIDDTTGAIGTTKKSGTFLSYDATYKTGFEPVYTADGNLYFDHIVFNRNSIELTQNITFIHDSTASAERINWKNQIARLIRVEWLGSALQTAGTHVNKLFHIDSAGKWTKFAKLGEQNGNDVVTATHVAKYNAAKDLFAQFVFVNEVATI